MSLSFHENTNNVMAGTVVSMLINALGIGWKEFLYIVIDIVTYLDILSGLITCICFVELIVHGLCYSRKGS